MKRRDLLRTGAVAAGGAFGCASVNPTAAPPQLRRARNIIFLIYDGTGYEDAAAANYFSTRLLQRPFVFQRLLARGATGSVWTSALTSIVTDSSAASTAFATGRKIMNRELTMFPDGRPLTTIMDLAKQRVMKTGLVTTTRVTHAKTRARPCDRRRPKASRRFASRSIESRRLSYGISMARSGTRLSTMCFRCLSVCRAFTAG